MSAAEHAALVAGLRRVLGADTVIETHISTVLLAGDRAYKLKKPVALGFLDFTTLAARERYCADEIRINRRTAPSIYLDVVPVTGTPDAPALAGAGPVIDYLVRMRRFDDSARLDRIAAADGLDGALADRLGATVAAFHATLDPAGAPPEAGSPHAVIAWARDNFAALDDRAEAPRLARLADWTDASHARRTHQFAARHAGGAVRECHGDLHLANIALIDGAPVLFDAIEFNPLLRWIDVMNDAAFLYMDLLDHGLAAQAWRFLNRYVEDAGDHAGLATLDFYAVYRAMVRAKVNHIRAAQTAGNERDGALATYRHYLALADRIAAGRPPLVIAMHGLAGSGKSTVAAALAETVGAIRLRSDVERKRLHGLAPQTRAGGPIDAGLYGTAASVATYARLGDLAERVIDAGHPAIVDATCLRRADRDALRAVAKAHGARFAIVECLAPEAMLRERVTARAQAGADPSDADLRVLDHQLRTREPLGRDERAEAWVVATDAAPEVMRARIAEVARELGLALAAYPRRPGGH